MRTLTAMPKERQFTMRSQGAAWALSSVPDYIYTENHDQEIIRLAERYMRVPDSRGMP